MPRLCFRAKHSPAKLEDRFLFISKTITDEVESTVDDPGQMKLL